LGIVCTLQKKALDTNLNIKEHSRGRVKTVFSAVIYNFPHALGHTYSIVCIYVPATKCSHIT